MSNSNVESTLNDLLTSLAKSVHLVDLTKLTLFLLGLVDLINPFNRIGWFSGTIDNSCFGGVYRSCMLNLSSRVWYTIYLSRGQSFKTIFVNRAN